MAARPNRLAPARGEVVISGVSDEEIERRATAYRASLIAEGMRTGEGRAKLACLGCSRPGSWRREVTSGGMHARFLSRQRVVIPRSEKISPR
jgi:hypothetical protein